MNKQIFRLAIPNILSNLTVPLLSTVDTSLMGYLPHVYYLGAIALGSTIFNNLYWAFIFLRMGTCGMTAQAFGNGDKVEAVTVLARGLLIGVTTGLGFIALQGPIADLSFQLMPSTAEVEHHARTYFGIRMFAAPAALAHFAIQGWMLGMQNAVYPLIISVFINVLNIILNIYFVKFLGMTSDGVALGTLISQYAGLICAWILLRKKYGEYLLHFDREAILHLESFRKYIGLNFDIFLRTIFLITAFTFFIRQSALQGEVVLAANNVLLQLWLVYAYGVDGLAYAAESIIGKYKGAKDPENLKRAVKWLFFWGFTLGGVTAVMYFIFKEPLLYIYTNQLPVIQEALKYYDWAIGACFILFYPFLWDGVYTGAVSTRAMRDTMGLATLAVYFPSYYILLNIFELNNFALWGAMILYMLSRGLGLHILAGKCIFKEET